MAQKDRHEQQSHEFAMKRQKEQFAEQRKLEKEKREAQRQNLMIGLNVVTQ